MFKKTLAAVAVCGAFGSAVAADVQIYGRIDAGLSYVDQQTEASAFFDAQSGNLTIQDDQSFSMDSGNSTGSRFGIKGSEDLGNGLKVGFVLENGFKSDTGALSSDGTIFDREATLSLSGGFGTVYAGRMGTLISDSGSVGFYAGAVSPFGTGWGYISGHTAVMADFSTRYSNTIAYVSPEFAGTKVYAQYAMGDTTENESTDDRYFAVGALYTSGPLQVATLVDYTNKQSHFTVDKTEIGVVDVDDTWTLNLGGSYDFGPAKTYVAAQYFKNAGDASNIFGSILDGVDANITGGLLDGAKDLALAALAIDGYGLNIGADIPAFGGLVKVSAGYMDGELDSVAGYDVDQLLQADVKAYALSAAYQYDLSKRTQFYTAAGYTYRELEVNGTVKPVGLSLEQDTYQVMAGIVHKF